MSENKNAPASAFRALLGRFIIEIVTGLLLLAALFFVIGAEQTRRAQETKTPAFAAVASDDIGTVIDAVDGDTLVVTFNSGRTTIDLIGIRAFPVTAGDPTVARYGRIAQEYLKQQTAGQTARIILPPHPMKRDGNLVASLFLMGADGHYGHDLGLDLIRQGHVLVDIRSASAAKDRYLEAEHTAVTKAVGFWRNETMKIRAIAVKAVWEED